MKFPVFIVAACLCFVPPTFAQTMPSESFLHRQATSVPALIQQVQTDAVTRQRFARFFHLKDTQVVPFLRKYVVEGTVPADQFYTVTCVQSTGIFYPTKQSFRKGEPVFCQREGRPLLQWRSGNPLVPFATAAEVVRVRVPAKAGVETVAPTKSPSIIIPAQSRPLSSVSPASHPAGEGSDGRSKL